LQLAQMLLSIGLEICLITHEMEVLLDLEIDMYVSIVLRFCEITKNLSECDSYFFGTSRISLSSPSCAFPRPSRLLVMR